MVSLPALLCLGLLGLLLVGEVRDQWGLRAVAKTGASLSFCAYAVTQGALETGPVGLAILVALLLSTVGDIALLWREQAPFLLGIVAFLLGHVAYVVAFGLLGVSPTGILAALVVLGPFAWGVWRWVGDRAGSQGTAVLAYIAVISTMVAFAVGASWRAPGALTTTLVLAAILFFVSDLCVARDRFVKKGTENRLVGLPLYYGGQLVFAHAVGLLPG